jgi:hypothetical protein
MLMAKLEDSLTRDFQISNKFSILSTTHLLKY